MNIRGFNGSGKSTIIHELKNKYGYNNIYQNDKIIAIQIPKLNVIVLGSYERTCGGCDTYDSVRKVYQRTLYFLNRYPNSHIIMEGALFSTIKSKPLEFFRKLNEKYDLNIIIVLLTTDPGTCVNNILEHRNGNINYSNSKYNAVLKSATIIGEEFPLYRLANNSTKEDLMNRFLKIYLKNIME